MSTEFQAQIDALWAAIRNLEETVAAHAASTAAPAAVPRIEIIAPGTGGALPLATPSFADVPQEVAAAIKATLSAVLGHEAHIRSVKLLEEPGALTTWVTQGRVAAQSSHNPRTTHS